MRAIVAIDFSDATARVVDAAATIARHAGAHLVLVHVVPDEPAFVGYDVGPSSVRDSVALELRKEHRELQALAQTLRDRGADATALLLQGYAVPVLLREAERQDAALIVAGSHGHGAVYDLLIGSVSEKLIRESTRPVLVVPARPRPPGKEIG